MKALPVILWLSACSSTTGAPGGIEVDCHALECPTPGDVADGVAIFLGHAPLPLEPTITAEWHAVGETFGGWEDDEGRWHHIIALTVTPDRVMVSSFHALAWELMHVSHWRLDGDGDSNYEAPPGPWTAESTATVSDIVHEYDAEGLKP